MVTETLKGFKKFEAWQKGVYLAEEVYRLTQFFPKEERCGMISQMRRAANSIPSNIAEGYAKYTSDELRHGARIAFGSACELETQIILSKRLRFAPDAAFAKAEQLLNCVLRLCNGLASKTKPTNLQSLVSLNKSGT